MQRARLSLFALLISVVSLAVVSPVVGQSLRVDAEVQSHMVLQRDRPVVLAGHGEPGAPVRVVFAGSNTSTTVGDDGRWRVEFGALSTPGPHVIEVTSRSELARIEDVLIGDVWLASGQSNMQWPVSASDGADEARARAATLDQIRFRKVEQALAQEPVDGPPGGEWVRLSAASVMDVSAVAFEFAREVHGRTGVPIGIVQSAWGGSTAEAWTPRDALADHPRLAPILGRNGWRPPPDAEELVRVAERFDAAFARVMDRDEGVLAERTGVDRESEAWTDHLVPGVWEPTVGAYDGAAWVARDFELTPSQARGAGILHLAAIDDYDRAYVNGVLVGQTAGGVARPWMRPRAYTVPEGVLRPGTNTVAVHVLDTASGGGIRGEPDRVKLELRSGSVPLAGVWQVRLEPEVRVGTLPRGTLANNSNFRYPGGMYNAMIRPLEGIEIRGFLWYQGESNAGRAGEYRSLFPLLIRSWRERWGRGDLPFLFVQHAAFRDPVETPGVGSWPDIRQAQADTLRVPRTAMVSAIDAGETDDIHPRDKWTVGQRLARAALNMVYGEAVAYRGPTFAGVERVNTERGAGASRVLRPRRGASDIGRRATAGICSGGHRRRVSLGRGPD
ncbi:MAG: sialate O-acetylesterase [Planctomycetota bacterium]